MTFPIKKKTCLHFGLLAMAGLTISACATVPGLSEQGLAPCPDKPNCVSSQSGSHRHAIDPISYSGNREEALKRLLTIVSDLPRTRVITETADYIHVEFRSKWLGFVDDVEFWLPVEEPGTIHIRSASRLGYSDLGVNRKRMEGIRELFRAKGD